MSEAFYIPNSVKVPFIPDLVPTSADLFNNITGRINTGLEASINLYEDEWEYQTESTCMLVSLITAVYAAGGSVSQDIKNDLLGFARMQRPNGTFGITDDELWNTVAKDPNRNFDLIAVHAEESLEFIQDWPLPQNISQSSVTAAIVRRNAEIIKRTLDEGESLLILTFHVDDFGKQNGHRIAVVGYEVSKEGHMDVQIADGTFGTKCIPLEHFSAMIAGRGLEGKSESDIRVHVDNPRLEIINE